MRKTLIGGQTKPDDYEVIHDGRSIGRIRLATERAWQGTVWVWNVNPPLPIPPWCNGTAGSLDEAKTAFRAAWERFYATLTPEQIARWRATDDAAKKDRK